MRPRAEAVYKAGVQGKPAFLPGEVCRQATGVVTLAEKSG
jgi:hypothetical protein